MIQPNCIIITSFNPNINLINIFTTEMIFDLTTKISKCYLVTISLIAFINVIEQLFENNSMSPLAWVFIFIWLTIIHHEISKVLQAKPIYLELVQIASLSKNSVLKCVLKSVSLKPMDFNKSTTPDTSLPNIYTMSNNVAY